MIVTLIGVVGLVCLSNAMPLAKRMIDMTYVFDETTQRFPSYEPFRIVNVVNRTIEEFGGIWAQFEEYSSPTHVGTHMDAPAHGSKGGMTIEQIPVTEFVAPAAVIDITAKAELNPDAEATVEDLRNWESGTGQSLNGTIILLRSGWGPKWHDRDAFYGSTDSGIHSLHFPGIAAEACQWLVDNRSIKGIGTDTLSIDIGQTKNFPSHRIILGRGLYILENVANMEQIPIYGAKLYVFPMKIGHGSGAPTRIVAEIPKIMHDLPSIENINEV